MVSSTTSLAKIFAPGKHQPAGQWLLIAAASVCALGIILSSQLVTQLMFLAAGLTFAGLAMLQQSSGWWTARAEMQLEARLIALVGLDVCPCFTSDAHGQIGFQNAAAAARFGAKPGGTLISALKDHFAAPSAVLYRLQTRANHSGAAREDVATRRGHLRLSVHRLSPARYLWRLEEFQDRATAVRGAETLSLPMLTANKAGVVLFTNDAMRRLLGGRPKRLDRVFTSPILHSGEEVEVSAAVGPVRAILAEVDGLGERREIYLLPVARHPNDESMSADFEHVPVALLKFEANGALRQANKAARDLLHLDGAPEMLHDLFEGLGRPVSDWLSDVVNERIAGAVPRCCARAVWAARCSCR